jgi:hypothetical protein
MHYFGWVRLVGEAVQTGEHSLDGENRTSREDQMTLGSFDTFPGGFVPRSSGCQVQSAANYHYAMSRIWGNIRLSMEQKLMAGLGLRITPFRVHHAGLYSVRSFRMLLSYTATCMRMLFMTLFAESMSLAANMVTWECGPSS